MHPELETHRRILVKAYRRYLLEDEALERMSAQAIRWLPEPHPRAERILGDAGSPLRKSYDRRNRALERLMRARAALREARALVMQRPRRQILLITIS